MELRIYNTLTRQKEKFVPIDENSIKIYSCGPTVYSDPHVGNLRYFVFSWLLWDICRNILGYKTTHVMNITDVGHLTDDGDHGEDKMEKGAKREGITAWDIARKYEDNFKKYLAALHVSFDAHPRATEYIKEQIDIVNMLTEKWYTYEIPQDGIYMDTSKVTDYGKLLGPSYKEHLAGLDAGNRVDAEWKKNPTDFALWKFSPNGEQRQMEWIFAGRRAGVLLNESNRTTLTEEEQATRGFPGWHIECSAMSRALLGDRFDIHTWWVDHIAVHHSDEIAQSEHSFCTHGKWVNYWMHAQFLNINGAKVSKSAWDDLSLPWLEEKWFSPLDVRYFFFTGQYRSFLDFTYDALEAAKTTRYNIIKKLAGLVGDRLGNFYDIQAEDINHLVYQQMIDPLLDDLDTPKCLAALQKVITKLMSDEKEQDIEVSTDKEDIISQNEYQILQDSILKTIFYLDTKVLHFGLYQWVEALTQEIVIDVPQDIQQLAQERRDAKQTKDFALADTIRIRLLDLGWIIEDTKEWYQIVKK